MTYTFLRAVVSFFILSFSINSKNVFAQKSLTGIANRESKNWLQDAQRNIEQTSYNFKKFQSQYVFANKQQALAFAVDGPQLASIPTNNKSFTKTSIQLCGLNGNTKQHLVLGDAVVFEKNNYLRYDYPSLSIEYKNDENGLRQNFIIRKKSKVSESLTLSLKISGDLTASLINNNSLDLLNKAGKLVLRYDDLVVWDANHKKLNAQMVKAEGDEIKIIVNDANAVYPITVDPLTHNPEWTTSANGILPALLTNFQLQVDAVLRL